MTQFIRFEETNDHEGERWNWWLQLDGNADELIKLRDQLRALEDTEQFELMFQLCDDEESESVVDKLVEYAEKDTGFYHPAHNKVVGSFTCPDFVTEEQLTRLFYKGGIDGFFEVDE